MKTNAYARNLLRIRVTALCLAIIGLAAVELRMGESLVARFGQTTAVRADGAQSPNVNLSQT